MGSADGTPRLTPPVNRLVTVHPPVTVTMPGAAPAPRPPPPVTGWPAPPPPVTVTMPDAAPAPRGPWWTSTAVVVALVLVGAGLRTAAYCGDRCLWIDEARLALNLVTRTPAGLLEPLDYDQGAPVGFLMLAKFCTDTFGAPERSLRLFPFLASLAGLVGFVWVARRLMPRPGVVLAVGLFALSPNLVSYATECKQYANDVAIAIGLLGLGLPLLEGRGGRNLHIGLAAAGAAAVWFSHPAAFVLGGVGTALLAL